MITQQGVCKNCGAAIRFLRTSAGKYLPIEPELFEWKNGTDGKLFTEEGGMIWAPQEGATGYLAHWGRCPGQEAYRKTLEIKKEWEKKDDDERDSCLAPEREVENEPCKRVPRSWMGNR